MALAKNHKNLIFFFISKKDLLMEEIN